MPQIYTDRIGTGANGLFEFGAISPAGGGAPPIGEYTIPASLNPSDSNINLILSNENMRFVQAAGGYSAVRSINSAKAGLRYFEATFKQVSSYSAIGLGLASANLADYVGSAGSIGVGHTGDVYSGGSRKGGTTTFSVDDTVCVAVDFSHRTVWFRKNGGAWIEPTSGGGPLLDGKKGYPLPAGTNFFVMLSSAGSGNETVFRNSAESFLYDMPAEFSAWDQGPDALHPIVVPSYLNPADKYSTIGLSAANMRVTISENAWRSVRSFDTHASGRYYYEVLVEQIFSSFAAAGVANSTAVLSTYIGANVNGVSLVTNGSFFYNGASTPQTPALTNGDTICVAIDIDAKLIWYRKNDEAWLPYVDGGETPSSFEGGLNSRVSGNVFIGLSVQSVIDQLLLRTAAADFAYTVPTGFLPWNSKLA